MESGQRVSRKGRKLGSSRRRQTREPADGQDASSAPEPESWSFQAELHNFFQDCGAKERGFVTREDMTVAKFSFLGSEEEPEMIFDWVDMERKGRLSLDEFSSGLKSIFGSNLSTHRLRRRRPLSSKRGSAADSFPALEEADTEEKEAFSAFVEQLGASHLLPEQMEIWQLWAKLRQEEPHLAGNLEGFLAKMTSRLQETRADKEALELTLRKRDSDHHREVQELYNEMEQQIQRERQQLQAESDSRGLALSSQMQEVLEAKEREVQQLAEGQRELEAQLYQLSSTQQEASSENQQLRETEQDLASRLEEVQGQLQVTKGHLEAAKGRVSWQVEEEEPRQVERPPAPQGSIPEETPLPELFGDNDDWDQLLSDFSSPPHRTLQIAWSPPPTPKDPSAPQTPRVVRQISISEPRSPLLGQKPSSDPRGPSEAKDISSEQPVESPNLEVEDKPRPDSGSYFLWDRPPAGESGSLVAATLKMLIPLEDGSPSPVEPPPPQAPAGTSELFQASDPDGKGPGPGPGPGPAPAKPPRQRETLLQNTHAAGSESGLGSPGAGTLTLGPVDSSQGLDPMAPTEVLEPGKLGPDEQDGHSGELGGDHSQVLRKDALPALHHQSLKKESWAEEGQQEDQDGQNIGPEQSEEVQGLVVGHSEHPLKDVLPATPQPGPPQAQTETEAPIPGKPSVPGSPFPTGAQPGDGAGSQNPTQTFLTTVELEVQHRPPALNAQAEGPPQSSEPRAANRPEDPVMDSPEAGLSLPPGNLPANEPQADPDYAFHIIFLGDSNVGKTSFLHLLHQDSFATGLTATVGVDFRVKTLLVDNKCFVLQLWDTAGQERYHSMTRQLLRKADGVVLMYDVTDQKSFAHVSYWLDCLQDAGSDKAVILLLGNKMDCTEERQVPTEIGRQLAKELGVSFGECSAALGHNILEPVVNLVRSLRMQEDHLKGSLVDVTPEKPPKRSGCCS
ncbi:PREDICTED: ras-related protein Rab-44 [Chrysochloris asiatica]|uniref:Ras-related protein Rab-44 n=1 Tax=Chrysochloris asiatica TaxID=185453 RepID=A0A9B0TG00_CHRAS|nr:PREDICTED: ras-related protein Rab-44 [Chrysochloris asiatica]